MLIIQRTCILKCPDFFEWCSRKRVPSLAVNIWHNISFILMQHSYMSVQELVTPVNYRNFANERRRVYKHLLIGGQYALWMSDYHWASDHWFVVVSLQRDDNDSIARTFIQSNGKDETTFILLKGFYLSTFIVNNTYDSEWALKLRSFDFNFFIDGFRSKTS